MILLHILRAALTRLNPGHPDPVYDDAIELFTTTSAAKTALQINEEKYRYIRDGIPVEYRTATGEVRQPQLRLLDFDTPDNNDFLAVRELWIKDPIYGYDRRPDIIGFVNGIPLLFIELKRTSRNV